MGGPAGTGGADGAGGIVWLENGETRPFEPREETRRPWLEESSGWGEPDVAGGADPKDDDAEPPELVWL